jgi:hypothetical protein
MEHNDQEKRKSNQQQSTSIKFKIQLTKLNALHNSNLTLEDARHHADSLTDCRIKCNIILI